MMVLSFGKCPRSTGTVPGAHLWPAPQLNRIAMLTFFSCMPRRSHTRARARKCGTRTWRSASVGPAGRRSSPWWSPWLDPPLEHGPGWSLAEIPQARPYLRTDIGPNPVYCSRYLSTIAAVACCRLI